MFRNFVVLFVLLISAFSCQYEEEKHINKVLKTSNTFFIVGFRRGYIPEELYAHQVVAKRWGIAYEDLGCNDEMGVKDEVIEQQNAKVEVFLSKKFGQNWREKFEREIKEEETKINTEIINIAECQDTVKALRKYVEAEHLELKPFVENILERDSTLRIYYRYCIPQTNDCNNKIQVEFTMHVKTKKMILVKF